MKKVLYRPSWQKLRVSCLAVNHPQGGFNTDAGTMDNLQRLANYVNDTYAVPPLPYIEQENIRMRLTMEEESACRVWRVLNLLNAVRMGFHGTGKVGSQGDLAIVVFRDNIREFHDGGKVAQAEHKWDWEVIQAELEEMWITERVWFTRIYNDLHRRQKVATRRRDQVGQDDINDTRPELIRFVGLMTEINRHAS